MQITITNANPVFQQFMDNHQQHLELLVRQPIRELSPLHHLNELATDFLDEDQLAAIEPLVPEETIVRLAGLIVLMQYTPLYLTAIGHILGMESAQYKTLFAALSLATNQAHQAVNDEFNARLAPTNN